MRVIFSKEAQKQFTRLSPKEKRKIAKKINDLSLDPLSGKRLRGDLSGFRAARAWPYRIIYVVIENYKILIISILHRQGGRLLLEINKFVKYHLTL